MTQNKLQKEFQDHMTPQIPFLLEKKKYFFGNMFNKTKQNQSLQKGQGICSRNAAVQVGKITSRVQFEVKEFHFKGQSVLTFMINVCAKVSFLKVTKTSFEFSFQNPLFALLIIRDFLSKQSRQSSGLHPAVFYLQGWSSRKDFFSVIKAGS